MRMDENSLQPMSSTLPATPRPSGAGSNPQPTETAPQKRTPGRPKGSMKKNPDPNAPPKVKRPVGRPRKDGLPAGSVQRAPRPVGRPRKRQTDTFNGPPGVANAAHPQPAGALMFPYGVGLLNFDCHHVKWSLISLKFLGTSPSTSVWVYALAAWSEWGACCRRPDAASTDPGPGVSYRSGP